MSDATEQELRQRIAYLESEVARLHELASTDPLTGISNRREFEDEMRRMIRWLHHSKRSTEQRVRFFVDSISVIFIDIDDFKHINDTYGHHVGDEVLRAVAHTIREHVRDIDFVCRWGGDEMVVALLGADAEHARLKAVEIAEALESVRVPGITVGESVYFSLGIANLGDYDGLDDLVSHADKAMYEAKRVRGKNSIVVFSDVTR